jgi:hypothetical protein
LGRLGGQDLHQVGDAEKLEDARGHVAELEQAEALANGRSFEADKGAEAGAIELGDIAEVDDDASVVTEEGMHNFFNLSRGIAYQAAVATDGDNLIAVLIFFG